MGTLLAQIKTELFCFGQVVEYIKGGAPWFGMSGNRTSINSWLGFLTGIPDLSLYGVGFSNFGVMALSGTINLGVKLHCERITCPEINDLFMGGQRNSLIPSAIPVDYTIEPRGKPNNYQNNWRCKRENTVNVGEVIWRQDSLTIMPTPIDENRLMKLFGIIHSEGGSYPYELNRERAVLCFLLAAKLSEVKPPTNFRHWSDTVKSAGEEMIQQSREIAA